MTKELQVSYQVGSEEVVLSNEVVRNYLVSGGGKVTDQEIVFYMKLCKARGLNPWIRDCYLIKYGDNDPAAMVVSKDVFLKRAQNNKRYLGHEVIISDDGKTATCKVYVENYKVPISVTVDYDEYVGLKKDGTVNKQWRKKPKLMLKKCALVGGLREAFTEDLGGLCIEDEIAKNANINEMDLPKEVDEVTDISEPKKSKKGVKKKQAHEDKGWEQVCESFKDTLGDEAFLKVLKANGYESIDEIIEEKRADMFEAWSKEAANCL